MSWTDQSHASGVPTEGAAQDADFFCFFPSAGASACGEAGSFGRGAAGIAACIYSLLTINPQGSHGDGLGAVSSCGLMD
jgi:hypothetical protein